MRIIDTNKSYTPYATVVEALVEHNGAEITLVTSYQSIHFNVEAEGKIGDTDSPQSWPVLDRVLGRKVWQAALAELEAQAAVADLAEIHKIIAEGGEDLEGYADSIEAGEREIIRTREEAAKLAPKLSSSELAEAEELVAVINQLRKI